MYGATHMATYDNPRKQFIGRLTQTSRALRTYFDAELRAVGLTLARGRLLLHLLQARHPVGQSELADVLEVEHPTVVRQLDALEQMGLIERQSLPGDRRAKTVVLTAEGRRAAENVTRLTDRISDRLLDGIDTKELALAEQLLARIGDNVERLSAAPAMAVSP